MVKIKLIVKMCLLLIWLFNWLKWGVVINVVIFGIEVMILLIKVIFLWLFNNCWIYKLMMGLIELLEVWMINVVINILRIMWGCFSFFKICFLDVVWFFLIGINFLWIKMRFKIKMSNKIVLVMKKVGW